MNRTGLFVALGIGCAVACIFAVAPQLDLALARLFFDNQLHHFVLAPVGVAELIRRAAMWLTWAIVWPAAFAPIRKLIRPDKPMPVAARTVVFLLSTILLTAIVLPNALFKEYWGRPRPINTKEFGGAHSFVAWWDPRGDNRHNGSFFSGEAATAFWTYAPAALTPPGIRPFAYAAATVFGLTIGGLRMAFGGHYASDVLAAGFVAFMVAWLFHRWIYHSARLDEFDRTIDQRLGQIGRGLRRPGFRWLVLVLLALTIFRLVALHFSVVDLFPDEARYWAWAQRPAFGYFSKPPLIAWIIAAATRLCGDSETCVRAASPLLYAGTSLVCYFLGRKIYGDRTGFWSGLCIITATGVVFSSRIISTDVALVFFWAIALFAFFKLLDRPSISWSIVLGVSLGLGLLAKYAMIYFVAGIFAAALVDVRTRALLRRGHLWWAAALATLIVIPNIIWNLTHGYATFEHTKGNITGGLRFNLFGPFAFIGAQFAVLGPVLFAVFLLALLRPRKFRLEPADRVLVAFAIPPLLLVTVAGAFASVKANWAAPAAVSATLVAAALLVRIDGRRWLVASVVIGLALQLILATTDAMADRVRVPLLANPDVYHRTLGWKIVAQESKKAAETIGAQSITSDHGDVLAELIYYLRGDRHPIYAWPSSDEPANQFDFDQPLPSGAPEPLLFVTDRCRPNRIADFFGDVSALPLIRAKTGPTTERKFCAFKLARMRRDVAPLNSAAE